MSWKRVTALAVVVGVLVTAAVVVPQVMTFEKENTMGLYPTPPGGSMEPIVEAMKKQQRHIDELSRPTGVQIGARKAKFVSKTERVSDVAIPGGAAGKLVEVEVPVPAGYTSAMVTATAMVRGQNFTSQTSYLYAWAYIDGDSGDIPGMGGRAVNGEITAGLITRSTSLENLEPGSSISVAAWGSVVTSGAPPTTPWVATAANNAAISTTVTFIR